MKRNRKMGRSRSLTSGMIRVILTCQVIPYIVLSAVLFFVFIERNSRQVENTLRSSMESSGRIVMENLNNAIEDSRQASYDGVIKKSYETFLKDGDESAMHRAVTDYLNRTYKFSKTVSNTILLYGDNVRMDYYTYSNVAGATYASIEEFRRDTVQAVRLCAKDLDTRTRLVCLSGHMYVVRNIVLSNYEPFATLVMELNMDRLFASLGNVIWGTDAIAMLDGESVYFRPADGGEQPETEHEGQVPVSEQESAESRISSLAAIMGRVREISEAPKDQGLVFTYDEKSHTGCLDMKVNGQRYALVAALDRFAMSSDRMAFLSAYAAVLLTLIPLFIATFWFFYVNIKKPIETLVKGSERIRSGQYGYITEPFERNGEIALLVDNFNHMSRSLEESFNRIYAEEIAGRDATLKALQSQINPHFLNNTLEIINWKARMNGNDDVSEMISALSVMMNAALNRNNEMFVTLEEELSYVDAYLYIIRERFGERFTFEKEVDSTLLDCQVPRLIIQPIVENAVEHGGDASGKITGRLRIYGDRDHLHIDVENNGVLSDEDKEKIACLLSEEKQPDAKMESSSIGIRNVHLRLKMLYGKESGLTIRSSLEGKTVSELMISKDRQDGTIPVKNV